MISPIQEKRAGGHLGEAAEAPASIGHTRREVVRSRRLIGAGSEEGGQAGGFVARSVVKQRPIRPGMEASGGRAWSRASASRTAAAGGAGRGGEGARQRGEVEPWVGPSQAGPGRDATELWAEGRLEPVLRSGRVRQGRG